MLTPQTPANLLPQSCNIVRSQVLSATCSIKSTYLLLPNSLWDKLEDLMLSVDALFTDACILPQSLSYLCIAF